MLFLFINIFQYLKIPCIIRTFFAKFIYNEYIRPYFLLHVGSTISVDNLLNLIV